MSGHPLSESEWATWLAVKHLSGQVLDAVGRDIEAATDLSSADFSILTRLEQLGDGVLPQAALLASLGWEKSRLSHQLTRMEARHLVERQRAGPGTVTIHTLPFGREQVVAAVPVHAAAVREHVLRHIEPAEARMLAKIVERLSRA